MAVNPIQRKTRTAFILGMLLAVLVAAIIITILVMQIKKLNEEKKAEQAMYIPIYVLNQDVKSGQIVTEEMLSRVMARKNLVPTNPIRNLSTFLDYAVVDGEGHSLLTDGAGVYFKVDSDHMEIFKDANGTYYTYDEDGNIANVSVKESNVISDDYGMYVKKETKNKTRVFLESATERYYKLVTTDGNNRKIEYMDNVIGISLIAKIDMNANTILTTDMLNYSNQPITNDLRKQEINVAILSADLATGDYVDIRLLLPNGQDYIVISKKQVEIPIVGSTDSLNTMWVNLTEDEILTLSCAIVDAWKIEGAKIYTSVYTDPGMQEAAIPTYLISTETAQLLVSDSNILAKAATEIAKRYSRDKRESYINSQIDPQSAASNYIEGVKESIQKSQTERQKYLNSLGY